MSIPPAERRRIVETHAAESGVDPAVLERVVNDVIAALPTVPAPSAPASPFSVPWMDSFLAHWALGEQVDISPVAAGLAEESVETLRRLVDVRFRERLAELQRVLGELRANEPPDGGPPEPGTPPVGPVVFLPSEAPDGGPPEPGTPPVGPQMGFLGDNPWILYWFLSLRAPLLLDVIDAHLTRRLEELTAGSR